MAATVVFPEPIPPVRPMTFTRRGISCYLTRVHRQRPVVPPAGCSTRRGELILDRGVILIAGRRVTDGRGLTPPFLDATPQVRRAYLQGLADVFKGKVPV